MKLLPLLASTTTAAVIQKLGVDPGALFPQYDGTCPDVTGTSTFDVTPYIATPWWTIATSPFFWYSETTACVSATYKLSEAFPGYVDVFNSELNPTAKSRLTPGTNFDTYRRSTSNGTAIQNPNLEGTLSVTFPYPRLAPENGANYIVLATDNESYSYVWSCGNYPGNKYRPVLWILNKDMDISTEARQQQVAYAIDLLEYQFGWDQARDFEGSMYKLVTEGCPAIPDFNEPSD